MIYFIHGLSNVGSNQTNASVQLDDVIMPDYIILMLFFLLITGPLGVLFNLSFIVFSLCKEELRKDYTWFLIGISVSNILYCFNMAVPEVIVVVLDIKPNNALCQVVGVIVLANGVSSVCIQPLLALNRFSALYYSHLQANYFSRRNIVIMLCAVYSICALLCIVLLALGDIGRLGNTICGPNIQNMAISHVFIFVMPIFIAHGVSILCGFKILYLIQSHQKVARRLELGNKIQDAKDIFRLIIIELAVPICFETPALVSCLLSSQVYIPQIVIVFTVGLFLTHPVLDPIIVVLVMKPFRNCAKEILMRIRGVTLVKSLGGSTN